MRVSRWLLIRLVATTIVIGCGSKDETTGPVDDLAVGTIVARIDGADWITTNAIAIYPSGRLVATGNGSNGLTFGFGVSAQAPGTFTVGGTGNASGTLTDASSTVWEAAVSGGSGSVTISSFSANEVSGTFSFTLVRTQGSSTPSTRVVTNGRFRVRY